MFSSATRRVAAAAAAAAGALTLGLGVTTATAADGDTMAAVLSCAGNLTVQVNTSTGVVSGFGNLRCSAAGQPLINSATLQLAGSAAGSGSVVQTRTADRLTYNTGQSTTLNPVTRTFVNFPGRTAEQGSGSTSGGLFHPSRLADSGVGTSSQTGVIRTFSLGVYALSLNVP
ncbi:hypothetical protein [Streptomyces hiroshimensis]|uniref:Spore coat protein U domain-containing protein n=1 Tax=Streptomyces hiroshimensis TaxID=66424 RepID=A0ABQ2Y7R7_9ACTN|nr:hypothetical protein [Streptomyces hiroshimensis]GGX71427.1 hypothetical protein GCM10010324_15730 [Streptomyces hiroshimensis]